MTKTAAHIAAARKPSEPRVAHAAPRQEWAGISQRHSPMFSTAATAWSAVRER